MHYFLMASLSFSLVSCNLAEPIHEARNDCKDKSFQALTDLCILSHNTMAGRLVGTQGNARARAYIITRLEAIGVKPVGERYIHEFEFERPIDFRNPESPLEVQKGYNIIARIKGADSSKIMAVTAHYDHIGTGEDTEIFNGADDNASGVAAILAVADYFAQNPPKHDVLIIAFDAEEGGLNGARAFIDSPIEGLGDITLNLNLDMLGYSPDNDIWVAGTYHTPSLLPLVERTAQTAKLDLKAGYDRPTGDPWQDWTLLSDHGPFHMAGIAFMYLGVEDHEYYHQPSDEFSIINPEFYSAVVDVAVGLAVEGDQWVEEHK